MSDVFPRVHIQTLALSPALILLVSVRARPAFSRAAFACNPVSSEILHPVLTHAENSSADTTSEQRRR